MNKIVHLMYKKITLTHRQGCHWSSEKWGTKKWGTKIFPRKSGGPKSKVGDQNVFLFSSVFWSKSSAVDSSESLWAKFYVQPKSDAADSTRN